MGGGSWTASTFRDYSRTVGRTVAEDGTVSGMSCHAQEEFKSRRLDPALNPKGVTRECRDTEEHPNTLPVILALDVTGSMGSAAIKVAQQLNVIMTELYSKVKDVEFLIMGIGDLSYDTAPIQASQFESDVRIAEQLDKIFFEAGGGGNSYESYTAAWWFGAHQCDLDCWKRGKKGIIITLGDEPLNPYLPADTLSKITGIPVQAEVDTKEIYQEAKEKYDIYHIAVDDPRTAYWHYSEMIKDSWSKYLDDKHFIVSNLDGLSKTIVGIVANESSSSMVGAVASEGGIGW